MASADDLFLCSNASDKDGAQALAPAPFVSPNITVLCADLARAIDGFRAEQRSDVDRLSAALIAWDGNQAIEERIRLLATACFYYQRIGCSFDGVPRGKAARDLARANSLINLERFSCIALSAVYLDSANFEEACKCLERALQLAREIGDPFLEVVAYATTGALLKEMGCYIDALAVIDKALSFEIATEPGKHTRFTTATNGLFCAHRLHDEGAALRYMQIASETIDSPLIDDVTRAAFEYNRAIYLLAHDDDETAELLIDAARRRLAASGNQRVDILLSTAAALCDWASRDIDREIRAKRDLRELYHRSKQTHLYHDDVLRALMQVHSRPQSREEAEVGMAYAKELVEYTTSVKHAKFYRHMSDNGVAVPPEARISQSALRGEPTRSDFDPLISARRWLADEAAAAPALADDDAPRPVQREIKKHDELTAIHDDLARLRTASLKSSIRTVAYDMAENWALAAEFFDDQTGQHCFRVGRLAGMLAAEIGLDEDFCVRIEHAARLHDIGKITVNELILLKPGPLDPGELTAMRAHAEAGSFLLQHADDPTLKMAAVIARHHHEWWNGTGYPLNLIGERIPIEARIVALADVYDALTNARPYKRAWSHRLTIEQMMCESGAHFDPRLIRPFLKVLERHVGSTAVPPSTQLHLRDMEANGLLVSRRKLMAAVNGC